MNLKIKQSLKHELKKPQPVGKTLGRWTASPVRVYRMTISRTWYSREAGAAQEYEIHYKVARRGPIRGIRRYLAKRCIPHFQQNIYRRFKRWILKRRVKVRFEREHPMLLTRSDRMIQIERRIMEYVGKRWNAIRLPSRLLHFAPKRRKAKSRKWRRKNARSQ